MSQDKDEKFFTKFVWVPDEALDGVMDKIRNEWTLVRSGEISAEDYDEDGGYVVVESWERKGQSAEVFYRDVYREEYAAIRMWVNYTESQKKSLYGVCEEFHLSEIRDFLFEDFLMKMALYQK